MHAMEPNSGRLWRKVRYVQVFYSLVTKNSFREQEAEIELGNIKKNVEISKSRRIVLNAYQISTSHLGLVVLLLLYTFAGAGIFHAIEGRKNRTPDAILLEQERNQTLNLFVTDLNSINLTALEFENITDILVRHLEKFEQRLHSKGLLQKRKDDSEIWSYWAAVGFCMSVYTTIGYGHMAPETTAGRWLCIVYAIIGIPLCLITLADLGLSFSKSLKYVYRKARRKCNRRQKRCNFKCSLKNCFSAKSKQDGDETDKKDSEVEKSPPEEMSKPHPDCQGYQSSLLSQVEEDSDLSSASLLCKDSHKTALDSLLEKECSKEEISDNNVSTRPTSIAKEEINGCKAPGKLWSSKLQRSIENSSKPNNEDPYQEECHLNDKARITAESVVSKLKQAKSDASSPTKPPLHRMLVNEKATRLIQHALVGREDSLLSADELDVHSHVPMILPIVITMVYILIGVLIYSHWEGWGFTEAFYFTFISLSTIGFGDYVSTGKYVMVSIMYQLLGLALVAMTVTFLMELANATLGKAKYKVDQLAEKKFGFAVVENGLPLQRRVPIGVPLKNRKLKTQLSEFI